jgi:hypothetical protein
LVRADPQKSLVDTNALAATPLPLLLMICGTEEKRRRLIENHQPLERIFEVIDVEPLSDSEMREFFSARIRPGRDEGIRRCHARADPLQRRISQGHALDR